MLACCGGKPSLASLASDLRPGSSIVLVLSLLHAQEDPKALRAARRPSVASGGGLWGMLHVGNNPIWLCAQNVVGMHGVRGTVPWWPKLQNWFMAGGLRGVCGV